MTPAQHATEAANLLAATTAPADSITGRRNARLAQVHAVLSTKAGTGSNYTSAETELTFAATPTGTTANLDRAHAYALLA